MDLIKTVTIKDKTYTYLVLAKVSIESNISKIESIHRCDNETIEKWHDQFKKELSKWYQTFIYDGNKLLINFDELYHERLKFDILIAIDINNCDPKEYKQKLIKKIYNDEPNLFFIAPLKSIIEENFSQRFYRNYLIHHLYEFNTYIKLMPSANIPNVDFTYDNGFKVSSNPYETTAIQCEFSKIFITI